MWDIQQTILNQVVLLVLTMLVFAFIVTQPYNSEYRDASRYASAIVPNITLFPDYVYKYMFGSIDNSTPFGSTMNNLNNV